MAPCSFNAALALQISEMRIAEKVWLENFSKCVPLHVLTGLVVSRGARCSCLVESFMMVPLFYNWC
jgi:hypothetical protein